MNNAANDFAALPDSFYVYDGAKGGRVIRDVDGEELAMLPRPEKVAFFEAVNRGAFELKGCMGAGLHYMRIAQ